MSKYVAMAIVNMVPHKGLRAVCLPPSMGSDFVEELVTAANGLASSPVWCIRLVPDIAPAPALPHVCVSQAIEYRAGSRLFVWIKGDFEPDSSFSSSIQYVIPPDFPANTGQGIRVWDLAHSFAALLKQAAPNNLDASSWKQVEESSRACCEFMQATFEKVGNQKVDWTDAWWEATARFFDNVAAQILSGPPGSFSPIQDVYACAGLPVPKSGTSNYQKLKPDLYARILEERFWTQESVAETLALVHARWGEHAIAELPWNEFASNLQSHGHAVAGVMLLGWEDKDNRRSVWKAVDEEQFSELLSIRGDTGEILIEWQGKPLPSLEGCAFILPSREANWDFPSAREVQVSFEKLTVVVPWIRELSGEGVTGNEMPELNVKPRVGWSFKTTAAKRTARGLEITGTLRFLCKSGGTWPAKTITLKCETVDSLVGRLDTDALCKVVLPSPWGLSTFVCHGGKSSKLFVGAGGKVTIKKQTCSSHDEAIQYELALRQESDAKIIAYDGHHEHGTKIDHSGITVGRATSTKWADTGWSGLSIITQVRLTNGLEIRGENLDIRGENEGQILVSIAVDEDQPHPWLPLAATVVGTTPSDAPATHEMANRLRGHLEATWVEMLSTLPQLAETAPIYFVLPTSDAETMRSEPVLGSPHVRWLAKPEANYECELENAGAGPSKALRELPEFAALLQALHDLMEELGRNGNGGPHVWPSRWQLGKLSRELVDAYLDAYTKLVQRAKQLDTEAVFWASYPFSAFVYSVNEAKLKAVLLSPLHPLRLAWLYGAERAVIESGAPSDAKRRDIAQLLEGWAFPFVGPAPAYGDASTLTATPIDAGPEQLFLGWSALVWFDNTNGSQIQLPISAAGWRLPGGSSSGLNQGGVGAAVRDFMRVYPHLPTLTMELFSSAPAPRSVELDMAVMRELARVAADEADAVPLPQSLRVLDSDHRQGPPPRRDDVFDALAVGGEDSMPSFEWAIYRGADAANIAADVRFVEDAQSSVAVAKAKGQTLGGFGKWPVRRFLGREIPDDKKDVILHYLVEPRSAEWRAYAEALHALEKVPFKTTDAIRIRSRGVLLGTAGKAQWVVTGNVLVDPGSVARAAISNVSHPAILWEWRPPYLPRRKSVASGFDFGRRPYMTVARVPKPFRERIQQLKGMTAESVDKMIQTLGRRGIGLASLLAMGDNHSEGALGFYLALKLLDIAKPSVDSAERRLFVVPLDAVNNLLVAIGGDPDSTARRADLLVMVIDSVDGEQFKITFLPIEIRCSGFTPGSSVFGFPSQDSQPVRNKIEQLEQTHRCLRNVVKALKPDDGRDVVIDLTAMGSVVETAFLTSEDQQDYALSAKCLSAIASGKCDYEVAAGLLLWFQPGEDGQPPYEYHAPKPDEPYAYLFVEAPKSAALWDESSTEKSLASKAVIDCQSCIVERYQHATATAAAVETVPAEPTMTVSDLPAKNADTKTVHPEVDGPSIEPAQPSTAPIAPPVVPPAPPPPVAQRPRIFVGSSSSYSEGIWWDPAHPAKRLNNSHTVILGSAGSGKTQVLSSFILELHKQGIPSLILDFKDDYSKPTFRDVIGADLYDATDGLPVNPLALPIDDMSGKVHATQQVYAIAGIFDAVYNLGDIQEPHLREALHKTYENAGIPRTSIKFVPGMKIPNFSEVKKELDEIDDKNLNARLSSIFELGLFRDGDLSVDQLLTKTTVLRFTQLPSEQLKKAAGGIVLRSVYNALLKRGHVHGLRLAIIIDEAHRVANLDPVKLLVKEARAYGVGVFLSSQEARDFEDFVFSNAGTILTLKLSESTDADRVAKLLAGAGEFKAVSEQLRNCDQFVGYMRNDQYKPYAKVRVKPFYERLAEG